MKGRREQRKAFQQQKHRDKVAESIERLRRGARAALDAGDMDTYQARSWKARALEALA